MHDDPDAPVALLANLHEFQAANLQSWLAEHHIEARLVPSQQINAIAIYTQLVGRDVIVRKADLEHARSLLPQFQHEMQAHREYWSLQSHGEDEMEGYEPRPLTRATRRMPLSAISIGAAALLILLVTEYVHWLLAIGISLGIMLVMAQWGDALRSTNRASTKDDPHHTHPHTHTHTHHSPDDNTFT